MLVPAQWLGSRKQQNESKGIRFVHIGLRRNTGINILNSQTIILFSSTVPSWSVYTSTRMYEVSHMDSPPGIMVNAKKYTVSKMKWDL